MGWSALSRRAEVPLSGPMPWVPTAPARMGSGGRSSWLPMAQKTPLRVALLLGSGQPASAPAQVGRALFPQ